MPVLDGWALFRETAVDKIITIALTLALAIVPAVKAQSELPPAALEMLKQFEKDAIELDKKLAGQVAEVRKKMAVDLKEIQDKFCKEAKLDEALAIRTLIRSLKSAGAPELDNDLPAAAREVYKQHEAEVSGIVKKAEAEFQIRRTEVADELKKVQDLFCKEAKLDEAVSVRDLIRAIRTNQSTANADPGYINNGSTDIGKVFFYEVTGVVTGGSIYGTDVYTTGSHLAMAAVHTGALRAGERGVVKVTILPAATHYEATTRHGVTSYGYGPWSVSFKVERVYGFVTKLPLGDPYQNKIKGKSKK